MTAFVTAGWCDATIQLSGTEFTATINQYKFDRPTVNIKDGDTDVTNQFYINYYIKGQEDNLTTIDNKQVTQSTVTGTYIARLYGLVTIGSKAGADVIRIVATPRSTSSYTSTIEASYTITVNEVEPEVVLSQEKFKVHTSQIFDYPTAKLYATLNGTRTEVTDHYDVSYSHSSDITDYSAWWILNHTMMQAPSTVESGLTITMTYTPKSDYEGTYQSYSKTYDVEMYESSSEAMQTSIEWPDGQTVIATNDATISLPTPIVRDQDGNDVSRLFKYNYTALDDLTDIVGELASRNNNLYGTWVAHFAYKVNGGARLLMTLQDLGQTTGDPVTYSTSPTYTTAEKDTVYIEGNRYKWHFSVQPATFELYKGSMKLTKDNWQMPTFVVYNAQGDRTDGGFQRRIGFIEGTEISGNHNSKVVSTSTYNGVTYTWYEAESYAFPNADWADWVIDFTNVTKQTNKTPYIIYSIYVYNAGQEEQATEYSDYTIDVKDKITTTLELSQTTLSANIISGALKGFSEPTATVRNVNGTAVTERFDLSYSIANADGSSTTGFTIGSSTGVISYDGKGTPDGKLIVTVSATAKSDYTDRYENPTSVTYTLTVKNTTFNYEVITDTDKPDAAHYGKLHFIGAGTMASGTVLNDLAGLSVQFGAQDDADWVFVNSSLSSDIDNEGSMTDENKVKVHTQGSEIVLNDDGIPTAGTFAILRPSVNGFLTIDGRWSNKNRYRLIKVENDVVAETTDFLNSYGQDITGETRMWKALIAGDTYYFFNYGADDGTYELTQLHGLMFEPAFINSEDDHEASTASTTFVNGYTGTISTLLTEASDNVTFTVDDISGVTLSDYLNVDSKTGVVTAKKSTIGITTSQDYVTIRATVTNRSKTVTKTPWFNLTITDIPSYVIADGETPSVGQQVTTTNYTTNITMTFGGWTYGSGTYTYNKSELTDGWRAAKTDTVGQGNRTIDGFVYASQGDQNARNENLGSFKYKDGSNTPWELPCYGTYLKFDPEENGTLIVYLLQNGATDYTGSKQWEDLQKGYQLKFRPLYILDEAARPVTLDDTWVMDEKLLPSNSKQSTHAGSYTEGYYRCWWRDGWVKQELADQIKAGNISKFTNSEYTNCPFDLYTGFNGSSTDLSEIMSNWAQFNDSTSSISRQEIIHLSSGGYTLISKSFVRYTFQVKAGKSYYVFMTGSKLSPCGFSFVPTYFQNESNKPTQPTLTLTDTDTFETVFTTYNTSQSTSNDISDAKITLNRQFGKGKWTGISLPFSVNEDKFTKFFGNNAQIITYDYFDNGTAHFTEHVVHSIVANRPYFICPTKDVASGSTIDHVTVEASYRTAMTTDDSSTDQKEYAAKAIFSPETASAGSYVFAGDNIYHLKTETSISAYRAYLYPLSSSAKPITAISVAAKGPTRGVDPIVTAIEEIINNNSGERLNTYYKGVYNLAGQKVGESLDGLPHGIYIYNGKKIMK